MGATAILENEIYLVSRHVRITLAQALSNHLNLGVAYKTTAGESGCFLSTTCVAGQAGSLEQAPFVEIRVDAIKDLETVEIMNLANFTELYLCVFPAVANPDNTTTQFELCLSDGEEKAWLLPFEFSWNQQVSLVAKLESSNFMGAKLSRVNRRLDATALRKTLPGALEMLKLLEPASDRERLHSETEKPQPKKSQNTTGRMMLSGLWGLTKGLFWMARFALRPMVLAGLLIGGGALYTLNFFNAISMHNWPIVGWLFPFAVTTIDITVNPPSPIDKLFTGFVAMQLIEVKYKDPLTKEKPTGYCYREYEVGFGYQNVTAQIFSDHMKAACALNDETLPKPAILSVNAIASDMRGDYTRTECEAWDANSEIRQRKILGKLAEQEELVKIQQKGQKVLGGHLRIYCTVSPIKVRL